jgi:hypothetical protein
MSAGGPKGIQSGSVQQIHHLGNGLSAVPYVCMSLLPDLMMGKWKENTADFRFAAADSIYFFSNK